MSPQFLQYPSEGRFFTAELFMPDASAAASPGILLCHEGSGPSYYIRERARQLAALGYAVLAPDLFGEPLIDAAQGRALIMSLVGDSTRLRGRLNAALGLLYELSGIDSTRLATIGFCFGGLAALELARSGASIRGAVSLHGGLSTSKPAKANVFSGSILVCTGAEDPFITSDQVLAFTREMTEAGIDWQVNIFGGAKHAFTNPYVDPDRSPGNAYHEPSSRKSWLQTSLFLKEIFRPEAA